MMMESSSINHSTVNQAVVVSKAAAMEDPPEESGWTAYFEDFSSHKDGDDDNEDSFSCSSFGVGSPSMVSDAASLPAWKSSSHHIPNMNPGLVCCSMVGSPNISPKKLTFKKTRAKEISHHDDSLEDTASSPVNSPKVSELRSVDMNPSRKTNDHFNSSLGKRGGLEQNGGMETGERSCEMMNLMNNGGEHEYTELKKRGLCLVPLSMLVNYLG